MDPEIPWLLVAREEVRQPQSSSSCGCRGEELQQHDIPRSPDLKIPVGDHGTGEIIIVVRWESRILNAQVQHGRLCRSLLSVNPTNAPRVG